MAETRGTTQKVIDLIARKGMSPTETARALGVSKSWIYHVSTRHDLPSNREIVPGSPTEHLILKEVVLSMMKLDPQLVSEAAAHASPFVNQAAARIMRMVKGLQGKVNQHEYRVGDAGRQPGEDPSAVPGDAEGLGS